MKNRPGNSVERLYAYQQDKQRKLETIRADEVAQLFKPHINENSQRITKNRKAEDALLKKLVQETDNVNYYEVQPSPNKKAPTQRQRGVQSTQNKAALKKTGLSKSPKTPSMTAKKSDKQASSTAKKTTIPAVKRKSQHKAAERSASRSKSPIIQNNQKVSAKRLIQYTPDGAYKNQKREARSNSRHSQASRSPSQHRTGKTTQGLPIKPSQLKTQNPKQR